SLASQSPVVPILGFVFMSQGASNAYLVATPAGDVLINTGLGSEAPVHKRAFERVSRNPFRYILRAQGHVDPVGGTILFRAAHPDVVVIAQENVFACQQDDERIKGFR